MENYDIATIRFYIQDKESKVFTDEDIQRVAKEAGCIWCAIAELWMLRGVMVDFDGGGGGGGYTVGLETYKDTSAKDLVGIANANAAYFRSKCTCGKNAYGFRRVVLNPIIPGIDD